MERQFLLAWLCSAAVVTFIRLLHATDIGYDTALQIQAGQHLLEGKSLSVYWPTTDDVAKPLTLEMLTQFRQATRFTPPHWRPLVSMRLFSSKSPERLPPFWAGGDGRGLRSLT